jgi:glycosyltransferase involved in cell wall biosynthesis
MRVAFISTMLGWSWGGSEELWSQTATLLKQTGHDVQASIVHWPPLSPKVAALRDLGINVEERPTFRIGRTQRLWNKLSFRNSRSVARLKQFKPDLVVISQGDYAGGFEWASICREAGIPYVIIVQCNSDLWWFEIGRIDHARESYSAASKVFCVSRSNRDQLDFQVGMKLPNTEVVWNPYSVPPEVAPAWPDEHTGWRLACVARLDPSAKGHDLLLKTLARPEWRGRPVQLNCFGSGHYEPSLRRMSEMLGLSNVAFRGHVANIRSIWEENHMLVLPSRYEGLPLALVEAMWCGRPAVVTDVAGNAEMCIDNETGFVAPAPTVPLLADTLQRAWDRREDWQRMGQAARVRAESQIPRDPIGVFAEKLISCAATARHVLTSVNPS